jgi:hypothetical protein
MFDVDVQQSAARLTCPTLVAHRDRDAAVPVEEGRLLAQIIPGARFLQLDSPNHFLFPEEPAWGTLVEALHAFLPPPLRRTFTVVVRFTAPVLVALAIPMAHSQPPNGKPGVVPIEC